MSAAHRTPRKRATSQRRFRRAFFELLEDRRLLAASSCDLFDLSVTGACWHYNDTFATATNFGQRSQDFDIVGQSLYDSGGVQDVDVFAFTTVATASSSDRIVVNTSNFWETDGFFFYYGNVELQLHGVLPNGQTVFSRSASTGITQSGSATISLAGLPPATYLVQVRDISGLTISGNYSLDIDVPAAITPDIWEPLESQAVPWNLGLIDQSFSLNGNIHAAGDDDYFTFRIAGNGNANDYVRLTSDHTRGDINLAVWDAFGNQRYSATTNDVETVSLSGLPPGIYTAHVYGGINTNPAYTLSFATPPVPKADRYDSGLLRNDFLFTATDLGTPQGAGSETMLSLEANDVDWFRVRTADTSSVFHQIGVAFDGSRGNVDLAFYDSAGNLLAVSNHPTGSSETIFLNGLLPGSYYVAVYGQSNANYTLSWNLPNAPVGDSMEPNNTFAAATDLDVVEGEVQFNDLSIHTYGNDDWYRFHIDSAGREGHYVEINFDHRRGDLDLALYDSTGSILGSSNGVSNRERISLAGLPAGDYYVWVGGFLGAINPSYRLSFAAPQATAQDFTEAAAPPYDLGKRQGTSIVTGLSIHDSSDIDWFQFELTGTGGGQHAVTVDHNAAVGLLDAVLFDSNGLYLGQASGSARYSQSAGAANEIPLAGLEPGVYLLGVYSAEGDPNPQYELRFDAPGGVLAGDYLESNNSSAAATDLGAVHGLETWTDPTRPLSIHDATDTDWYEFELTQTANVGHFAAIAFDHQRGDLDLRLYRQTTGGAAESVSIRASESVNNVERVSLDALQAGHYYLQVVGNNNATNPVYGLIINAPGGDRFENNNTRDRATELGRTTIDANGQRILGPLTGAELWTNLSLHADDGDPNNGTGPDVDWYEIDLAEDAGPSHFAQIRFSHALGNLELEVRNASGSISRRSHSTSDNEMVTLDGLRAADGPYYVVVTGFEGQSNPYYELRINAPEPVRPDVYENNDTRGTASNLGVVRGWRMLADRDRPLSIEANDDDWYRFEIAATADSGHFVAIAFDHALGDLDLALYDSSGDELDASRTANQMELLSLATLPAGVYYARVSGNNGADNPRYSLGILAPGIADVDPYEINDTLSDATDFGLVTGVETLTGLSLHDDSDIDVFTFEMAATGQRGHGVEIAFGHTRGDLDLAIVSPDGQRRESVSVSNMEHISLDGMPAGVYRVEVFGKANPSYSLMLRTPEPDGDFAEATAGTTNNDSKADAYDLRTILGRQTLNDLSIHSVTDVDWYRFDLAADAAANHYAAISFDARIGDLDLYLVDSAGTVLRASETLEGVERVSLTDLAADQGPYYLQVEGHRGATNPSYALQINGPAADVRSDWAEPNDSRQTSHSLQQIEGVQTWSQLSLHLDSDVDWYEFTMLPGTVGLAGHAVSITFDDAQGNLDLELYSSANPQNPLVSANVGDRERISLTGLTAEDGPFAIKVSGSANPSYTLAIDAPLDAAADWAERHADRLDNDSLASAYDLRIVQGMNSLSHLSIDPADDQDYFRFELPTGGDTVSYARIDFRHDDGNLTLQLLDAADAELASSASSTNFEQLSLAGLAGGVYFLRIVGATAETTNPAYTLTVAAPGGLVPDFAETNDTPAQAFNLRDLESSGARTRDGLGGTPGFFGATGFFSQSTIPSSLNTWAGQPGASLALHSTVAQAGFEPGGFLNQLAAGVNPLLLLDDSFGSTQYVNSALSFDPLAYLNDMWGATQAGVQSVANLLEGTGSFGQSTGNSYGSLLPLGGTSGLTGLAALGGLYNPYQAQSNYATAVALNQFNQQLNNLFSFTANTGLLGGTGYSPAFSYLIGGGYLSSPSCNPYSSFQIIGGPPPCRNITGNGVVEDSAVRLDGLSLHNGNDEDWFRFELSRDGREGQFARVTLGGERRNIELALFADDVVTSPTSTLPIDRVEAFAAEFGVPLAGLASGTYFLRIRGDAVENYVLEIDATPAVELTGDWSENNDTQVDAFDLRKVEGTQEYGELSIHNSMDQDWFEFETTAVGLPGHFVQIGFRNADGDLDLTLFDNQGTEVGRSGGVQNEERVSLDGLPAGRYFVRVTGYRGAVNPNYSLAIHAPNPTIRADHLEPNSTRGTATVLDASGGVDHIDSLTIHAGDADWFRFTTLGVGAASSSVGIEFDHSLGDLALRLYDSTGVLLTSSTGTDNHERITMAGRAAGTYFVKVDGASASTSNNYRLSLDVPTIAEPNRQVDDWTIMVYMTASDLEQYAFQDINEMELAALRLPSTVNVVVLLDQNSSPVISNQGPRFGMTFPTGTSAAWGDTGRAIIRGDADPNRITTEFERIGERNTGSADSLVEFVTWAVDVAPAERYALVMWDHGGGLTGTNLDHESAGDMLTTSELVAALTQLRQQSSAVELDLLAFDACQMAMTEVAYATREFADVFVGSEENEGGEGYNYYTTLSYLFSYPSTVTPQMFGAGIVASYGLQYVNGRIYQDTHSATNTIAVEGVTQALRQFVDIATTVASPLDWALLRGSLTNVPVYPVSIGFHRDLGRFMDHIQRTAVNPLIATAANQVVVALSNAVLARTSDRRGSSGLAILLPRPDQGVTLAGMLPSYRSEHADFVAATRWDQFLTGFIDPLASVATFYQSDWAGRNAVSARAFNLGDLISEGYVFPNLQTSPSELDWYRFTLHATATSADRVQLVAPDSLDNPPTLELWGESSEGSEGFQRLAVGSIVDGTVEMDLASLTEGEYYIRIDASQSESSIAYELRIDAPRATLDVDWARGNDRAEKSRDLGVISSNVLLNGLSLTPGDADWFTFSTPRLASEANHYVRIMSPTGATFAAELQTIDGFTVSSADGTSEAKLAFSVGGGASYRLRAAGLELTEAVPLTVLFESEQPNTDPTLSGLIDVTINEDQVAGPLSFQVGDLETAPDRLVVAATSSNATLLPDSAIVITGEDADRTVTMTPIGDRSGAVDVTFTVTDGDGAVASRVVKLTVMPVADAPTDLALDQSTVMENAAGVIVGELSVTDPDSTGVHEFLVSDSRFVVELGRLKLADGVSLDYEAEPQVELEITVHDAGVPELGLAKTFAIQVRDINEKPTSVVLVGTQVIEWRDGLEVGMFAVSDPDKSDSHTILVQDGRFEVVDGRLRLKDGQFLQSNDAATLDLLIDVKDSGEPPQSLRTSVRVEVLADPTPWQNWKNRLDVNRDGEISPIDALLVINDINLLGAGPIERPTTQPTAYPDVNGDNERSAIDVLLIVNALNLQTTNAKAAGESSFDVMFPFVAQIGHDSGKPSERRSRQYREAMRVPAVASPAALIPSPFDANALAHAVFSQVSRRKTPRHRVDNVDAVFREFASQVD